MRGTARAMGKRLKGSMRTVQPLYTHRGQPPLDEVAALRSWLKVRPADGSDSLFVSQKGGRLDRTQFFRIFKPLPRSPVCRPRSVTLIV